MDLRQICYFVTVAERGSFTSAASALNERLGSVHQHFVPGRCVYSARQQEEPVRQLPKKLAGLGVVLADLAPTSSQE
jgi:hypothetical protein